MNTPPRRIREAFRALERRLAARRLAALTGRMRVLLLLLAGYVASLAYWKTRVPLDGLRRARGEPAAALAVAAILATLAVLGALAAAWRRAAASSGAGRMEWLALPLPPQAVGRHLRFEAQLWAVTTLPAALPVLLAGAGLVSAVHLALLALAYAPLAWLLAGLAASIAAAATRARPTRAANLPAAVLGLLPPGRSAPPQPCRAPRWRAEIPWRALARLDALASSRRSGARTRAALAVLWVVAGAVAWFAPAPALTRRALAYAAYAGAAVSLGAWAIARTCTDPPSALRPLPLSVADAWRARATRITVALAAAGVLGALLAVALPPLARLGLLLTFVPSGAAIALLGLNLGLTLAPRAMIAENLYYGWLAVALIASWMIPFLGWAVLAAALAHSGLRLARASRTEIS